MSWRAFGSLVAIVIVTVVAAALLDVARPFGINAGPAIGLGCLAAYHLGRRVGPR